MKPRLMLVFLVAFSLALACRKSTPPTVPVRDADAEVPSPLIVDASTDSPARAGDASPPVTKRKPRAGVNLSGAEFGVVLGKHGIDYTWDKTDAAADYFAARGFTTFRLPFRHERLQPKLQGPLDEAEWARLKARVDHITGIVVPRGVTVTLEAQNSYRHGIGCVSSAKADPKCKIVSEVEVGDFWGRVAVRLKDNPMVAIEATNEPHDTPSEDDAKRGAAVLREVRRVGFTGVVVVPTSAWSGAGHFDEDFNGTTRSSKTMLTVPIDGDVLFDVHVYLDADATGVGECVAPDIGEQRLKAFVTWLRANGRRGMVGEIAAINTAKCKVAHATALSFIEANGDVLDSWMHWGAGAWSFSGTGIYPLSIGPMPPGQPEKPLLAWYGPFLDLPTKAAGEGP